MFVSSLVQGGQVRLGLQGGQVRLGHQVVRQGVAQIARPSQQVRQGEKDVGNFALSPYNQTPAV